MPLPRVTESVYDAVRTERLSMSDSQLIGDANRLITDLLSTNPIVAQFLTRHYNTAREEFGDRGGICLLMSLVSMYRLLDAEQTIRDATATKSATLPVVQQEDADISDLITLTIQMQKEQPVLTMGMSIIAKSTGPPDFQELAFRMSVMTYSILARAAKRELLESNTKEPV